MAAAAPPPLERSTSIRLPDHSLFEDEVEEQPSLQSDERVTKPGEAECQLALYGRPVSAEEAARLCPPGTEGLVWHATIVADDASDGGDASKRRGKYETKFLADGSIKPRRGPPLVRATDFFSSLVQTADGRWIFSGVLNGWPGLTCLELRSVTSRVVGGLMTGLVHKIERTWDATRDGAKRPAYPQGHQSVRVTLRAPAWTTQGYAPDVPGFVWWYFQTRPQPSLAHGENIFAALQQGPTPGATATRVHLFAHRYARLHETAKDRILYHAAILLEWSHGAHCTVVELATLNGVGGRLGKSNWCDDKLEARTGLYRSLPATMVAPWKGDLAEIRCVDVYARGLDEFKRYCAKYTGADQRFLDPQFVHSSPVRLAHRSADDIGRYLINYMSRDRRYTEKVRNCQAFAADFFGFAAGKKGIQPFMELLRPLYTPRPHLFLYDASMYNNPVPDEETIAQGGEAGAAAAAAPNSTANGGDGVSPAAAAAPPPATEAKAQEPTPPPPKRAMSKGDAQAFVAKHGLEQKMAEAVASALKADSGDPIADIIAALQQS